MAFLTVVEILVLCLAGFVIFKNRKNTIAESASYAVISTLMTLSLLCQLALLLQWPPVTIFFEIAVFISAIAVLHRHRANLYEAASVLKSFARANPSAAAIMIPGCIYLALLAVIIPPGVSYWNSLGRILVLQQHGFFSSAALPASLGPAFPLNHAAPAHMFLRYGSDAGVGVFGWMAYISIAFSTYALSRRYSWPSTAVTVTLVVISMPRLVFHASSPGNEIMPAATALFCLLAAYRTVERLGVADLLLLVAGIMFAVSDGKAGFIFPMILFALSWVLLARRHGTRALWFTIRQNKWGTIAAFFPVVIFSQAWLFLWNMTTQESWVGTYSMLPLTFNADGLQGSLANFIRYLFESMHFTLPVERFFKLIFHFDPTETLVWVVNYLPGFLSGDAGLGEAFFITWEPNEIYSWYGPFGFLLVIPAILFALRRGPRRLKTVGVAIAGYVYLLSLIFAWSPGNARLFVMVFVCSGFFSAFFLPPWRFGRGGKLAFQWVSGCLFFYALMFNTMKPMVPIGSFAEKELMQTIEAPILKAEHFDRMEPKNIWLKTNFGVDRIVEATDYFGDRRVKEAVRMMGNPAQIVYVTDSLFHVYPFILSKPHATVILLSPGQVKAHSLSDVQGADVILCFGENTCDEGEIFLVKKKWDKRSQGVVGIQTVMLEKKDQR